MRGVLAADTVVTGRGYSSKAAFWAADTVVKTKSWAADTVVNVLVIRGFTHQNAPKKSRMHFFRFLQ